MLINASSIKTLNRYREAVRVDSAIINIKEPLGIIYEEVAHRLNCRENLIEIMQELNEHEPLKGDRFAFYVGIKNAQEAVTREMFFSLLRHTETVWCGEAENRSHEGQLCNMIGRFIISRLADYFSQNESLFDNSEKKEVCQRMANFVVHPTLKESNITKAIAQLRVGNVEYVISKTIEKILSGTSLREEVLEMDLKIERSAISLTNGFEILLAKDSAGSEIVATLIMGDPKKSAKAAYIDTPFGYTDEGNVRGIYKDSLVAMVSGGFRNNRLRPTDFCSVNGEIYNYLISGKEALVIFYPNGSLEIKELNALKKQSGKILVPSEKLEDFTEFVKGIKEEKLSVMQTFLLINDGELKIHSNSSKTASKRRLLVEMKDGIFAIVNFEEKMTLLESAVLAQKMGAIKAVVLDTGQYDYGNFIDSNGRRHELVWQNSNPASYVVFYSGQFQ